MANLMAILGRLKHGCEKADCSEDVICSSHAEQTFGGKFVPWLRQKQAFN